MACFLTQQSAEKAVKAVYQAIGAEASSQSVAGLLLNLPGEFKSPSELA